MLLTAGLTENLDKLSLLHRRSCWASWLAATIFWFSGASTQAVSTGAYRAVEFISTHIRLDEVVKASTKDSKKVVEICTIYAKGMINIFLAMFFGTLACACLDPYFFIGYLISMALFGLYQAIFMANAGGAWDNAKKYVETDLHDKGTDRYNGDGCRRHRRRPVQGYLVRGDKPDHQVHHAVRTARRRDGGRAPSCRDWARGVRAGGGVPRRQLLLRLPELYGMRIVVKKEDR